MDELQTVWLGLKAHIEQLAAERQQYLEVFEQAPDAYLVTNAEGTIVEVNGAAVDLLQRRKAQVRGRPLPVFIAPERRPGFRSRLARLAAGDRAADRRWRSLLDSRGVRIEVSVTARVIQPPGGGICWLLQPAA